MVTYYYTYSNIIFYELHWHICMFNLKSKLSNLESNKLLHLLFLLVLLDLLVFNKLHHSFRNFALINFLSPLTVLKKRIQQLLAYSVLLESTVRWANGVPFTPCQTVCSVTPHTHPKPLLLVPRGEMGTS